MRTSHRCKTAGDKKWTDDKVHYKLIPIDHGMSLPDSLEICE
ncbi:MAG: hypothetical protein P4M11_15120 [Candidatus Pacebacteria bacterium]|nr:hypothetical protein [Candidatus Paceibacterota bacterium]